MGACILVAHLTGLNIKTLRSLVARFERSGWCDSGPWLAVGSDWMAGGQATTSVSDPLDAPWPTSAIPVANHQPLITITTNHKPPTTPPVSPPTSSRFCSRGMLRPRSGCTMGSLGWAQCYWCWRWEYAMYIPDWVGRPLCMWCGDREMDGYRPPWQPDARARLQLVLQSRLPGRAAELVAEFARPGWQV